MPTKGKKSLPVDEETHKLIAVEAAQTGRDMYVLVRDAWESYKSKGLVSRETGEGAALAPNLVLSQNLHHKLKQLANALLMVQLQLQELLNAPEESITIPHTDDLARKTLSSIPSAGDSKAGARTLRANKRQSVRGHPK